MYLQYVIDAETAQVARALGCAPHFSSWAVLQPDRESERARERERERERKISMGVPAYGEAALREHVAAAAGARGSLPLSRRCAV